VQRAVVVHHESPAVGEGLEPVMTAAPAAEVVDPSLGSPMPDVSAAAVYARIRSDPSGRALGVARQVENCRRLAECLGWRVAQEYVDNDLSAYSGNRRPAYAQMLTDLADALCDAVICYHVDRLTRRPIQTYVLLQIKGTPFRGALVKRVRNAVLKFDAPLL
jgi:hypothetical protein